MTAPAPALRYGQHPVIVPRGLAGCPVLDARGLAPANDPATLWRQAARDAARRVAARAGSKEHVALVVPDRTRPLPLNELLPPLLAELADAGIAASRITIAPASGIHRPMTRGELAAWIGADASYSGATLAPHDADDETGCVALGHTTSGISVAAHARVARSSVALLLGRIVFHYIAGFGGGPKLLVPGVAGRATILGVHSRCLDPRPGAGRHARAVAGVLEGNPMHRAVAEAARLFPPAVALHILLAADGALAEVRVGDAFGDHHRAAESYAAAYRAVVAEPLDAVVVSAGGHPLDRDLVQAHKALDAVAPVVRDGGAVVLLAACADGVGNNELRTGLELGPAAAIEDSLRRDFRVGVHTALALRQKTTRLRVLALTELPDDLLALAGVERVHSLDQAARVIYQSYGADARVALAPRGPALLYQVAPPRI